MEDAVGLDVIAERQKLGDPEDFHAGGSDCSGIVWATGKDVKNVKVGDEGIVHSGWWRPDDPDDMEPAPPARAPGPLAAGGGAGEGGLPGPPEIWIS